MTRTSLGLLNNLQLESILLAMELSCMPKKKLSLASRPFMADALIGITIICHSQSALNNQRMHDGGKQQQCKVRVWNKYSCRFTRAICMSLTTRKRNSQTKWKNSKQRENEKRRRRTKFYCRLRDSRLVESKSATERKIAAENFDRFFCISNSHAIGMSVRLVCAENDTECSTRSALNTIITKQRHLNEETRDQKTLQGASWELTMTII